MRLARLALGTAGLNAANALLALGVSVVLARALGPAGFGAYAFAVSAALLAAAACKLGLPQLALREAARYQLGERWGALRGLLRAGTLAAGAMGLGAFLAAAGWVLAGGSELVLAAAALAGLLALNGIWSAALRGLQRVAAGQFTEQLLVTALLLAGAAGLLAAGRLTPLAVLAAHAAAAGAAFLAALLLVRRALAPAAPEYGEAPAWRRAAVPFFAISGLQIVNTQADLFLVGALATSAEAGLYRVAVQGSHLVAFALFAVNAAVAPRISRLHAAGDHTGLQRLATWAARAVLLVALPTAGALIFFGAPILGWVFGDAYRAAYVPLALLCAGQLASCLLGSVALLLNMTGHERATATAFAWGAVLNVALNLLLIPRYGPAGAAAATSATLLLWNAMLCRQVWRLLGIQSMAFRFPFAARA